MMILYDTSSSLTLQQLTKDMQKLPVNFTVALVKRTLRVSTEVNTLPCYAVGIGSRHIESVLLDASSTSFCFFVLTTTQPKPQAFLLVVWWNSTRRVLRP